jgi:hypothetical protein
MMKEGRGGRNSLRASFGIQGGKLFLYRHLQGGRPFYLSPGLKPRAESCSPRPHRYAKRCGPGLRDETRIFGTKIDLDTCPQNRRAQPKSEELEIRARSSGRLNSLKQISRVSADRWQDHRDGLVLGGISLVRESGSHLSG